MFDGTHNTGTCAVLVIAALVTSTTAQEREDRTLLSWSQMRAIVEQASGERAMQTVTSIDPYPHLRARAEYEGHFAEMETLARLAQEAGFSDVKLESYPLTTPLWNASQGELWMVEPELKKLYDIHDVIIAGVSGSETGDVTAEVVHVGAGDRPQDYAGRDVKGKIVLGSAQAGVLQRSAIFEHEAAGVISYESHRRDAFPDEVLDQEHINPAPQGKTTGFAWAISPRVAREIIDRLDAGQKVRLRSVFKTESYPGKHELVHAMIPGDGSSTQEVMVSAHLLELHLKQGANDNASGTAVTLEMGRAYMKLVADGKLPKPKRNIHFTWIDEFRGTREWLKQHDEVRKRLIADLNFDQVGDNLRLSSSFYTLHRTPDTLPTYLNDLCASFLDFVAKTNRERAIYRTHGYDFSMPIVAPTGSRDPFYAQVDKQFAASDQRAYIDLGIPGALFNDWPDMWYHSSYDRVDKGILDATQMKRAAVIGIGAMSVLAGADDAMALRVASESLARGAERMSAAERRGLEYLSGATDDPSLMTAYTDARNAIRHQTAVEHVVIQSASTLFTDPAAAKKLAAFDPLIDARAAALQAEITATYRLQAEQRHIVASEPTMSEAETLAARQMPERTAAVLAPPFVRAALAKLPDAERASAEAALAKLPDTMTAEFTTLMGQHKTTLEIRDFLSGEFDPLPLADLVDYLRVNEKLGFMKIVERPEPAPAKKIK
jgi:aminopeptidase YwaD